MKINTTKKWCVEKYYILWLFWAPSTISSIRRLAGMYIEKIAD
jgi:hypothetical protein